MFDMAWPDCVRRAQPAMPPPNSFGTARMPLLPSEWQDWQAFFTVSTHASCVLMFALIPLPLSPVPGNSLLAGILSSEYQYMPGWYSAAAAALGAGTAVRLRVLPG